MLIGIISDTHGDVHGTRLATRVLGSLGVNAVLHCGDIGSAEVIPLFSAWPTHFVFGNVDHHGPLREAIEAAGQTCHERFGSLELEGLRIALLHGDDQTLLEETVRSGRWDLVCHGHTHRAKHLRHAKTLVVNPGAIARTSRASVAILDLPTLVVTPIQL
jgi:uncharacterized protein